jgi:hypothetical protein
MKHNHSTFLFMAILVGLFALSVYGYLYYKINLSLEKTAKAQSLVNSAALTKEREKTFMQTYEKTASKWSRLQSLFVKSGEVVNFIEAVESLGSESGSKVAISSIDADNLDNAPAGKEGSIRMNVTANGSWQSVMRALSLAETLPYKVTINNVQASASSENIKSSDVKGSKVETVSKAWNLSFSLQAAMISATSTSINIK